MMQQLDAIANASEACRLYLISITNAAQKQNARDEMARCEHRAVPCLACNKLYYPGDPLDKFRPRDTNGRFIPCSSIKNYCSANCKRGQGENKL